MRSQVQVLHRPPDQSQRGVSQFSPTQKPPARDVLSAVDAFLVSRTVAGCTSTTVETYRLILGAFTRSVGNLPLRECSLPVTQGYLTSLRERVNGTTVHMHFSKLRTFFWLVCGVWSAL